MSVILSRLHATGMNLTSVLDERSGQWNADSLLRLQKNDCVRSLVEDYALLNYEYQIHCAYLINHCNLDALKQMEEIAVALLLAELLEDIYCNYLNRPWEALRLQQDQKVYRDLLRKQGYSFPGIKPVETDDQSSYYSRLIRESTASLNWPRMFILRVRRMSLTLIPLLESLPQHRNNILAFNEQFNSIFAHSTWIFFAPRLFTNLIMAVGQIFPTASMSQEVRDLGWKTRIRLQIEHRWFEVGNDLVWSAAGLFNCFVLVGALAPYSLYLAVILQAYDVLLAAIRFYVEINRLETLKKQYQTLSVSSTTHPDIAGHLIALEERLNFEKRRLNIGVINTSALVLSASLALSMFVFNVFIPLIGALIAVLALLICYAAIQCVEKQRPTMDVASLQTRNFPSTPLSHFSLFKAPAKSSSTGDSLGASSVICS